MGICVKHELVSLTVGGGGPDADDGCISDCDVSDTDVTGGATPFGFADGEHISSASLILLDKVMGAGDVKASSKRQRN